MEKDWLKVWVFQMVLGCLLALLTVTGLVAWPWEKRLGSVLQDLESAWKKLSDLATVKG